MTHHRLTLETVAKTLRYVANCPDDLVDEEDYRNLADRVEAMRPDDQCPMCANTSACQSGCPLTDVRNAWGPV